MGPSNRRSYRRVFLAIAGVLFVPLAIACQNIVGLDDYYKAQCSGGGSCVDTGRTDGPINGEGGFDTGLDTGLFDGGRGAAPVSWARWFMPNYADAAGLPNVPAYTVNGEEITDTITGLVWRKSLQDGNALTTIEGAEASCKKIAPQDSWRVPKRIELVTLLDYSYSHLPPFIDSQFTIASVRVWSSSELRPFVGGPKQAYWSVNFDTGAVETREGGQPNAATLCVKAN